MFSLKLVVFPLYKNIVLAFLNKKNLNIMPMLVKLSQDIFVIWGFVTG